MSKVLRIFGRDGTELAELEVKATYSWILDDEGDCVFSLSTRDAKAREEIVQFGNLVLIEHDELPDWAGVIDLDPAERTWRGESVTITAYSLERLLKTGSTPLRKISGTPGSLFRQVIDFYNQETDLVILPGEIWLGGTQREEQMGDSCHTQIKRVTDREAVNWNISPRIEGGKMKLYANLYEKRGSDTGRLLFDGAEGNVEKLEPSLSEAGPIYNILTGYSDASTSGTRLSVTLRNEGSIKKFGPRRFSQTFSGVTDAATLKKSTQSALDQYALPFVQTAIHVLNKGSIFKLLDLGNQFRLNLSNVGFWNGALEFEDDIRIISMQYEGTPDKVKCGVRVV